LSEQQLIESPQEVPERRQLHCPEASHTPLQQSLLPLQDAPLKRHVHCPTRQVRLQQADPSAHAAPGERQAQCPVASQVPLQQSDPVVHGDPVGIQHPPAPHVKEQH
jgi:hypothetical protein